MFFNGFVKVGRGFDSDIVISFSETSEATSSSPCRLVDCDRTSDRPLYAMRDAPDFGPILH